jgi:hypothetical protein
MKYSLTEKGNILKERTANLTRFLSKTGRSAYKDKPEQTKILIKRVRELLVEIETDLEIK